MCTIILELIVLGIYLCLKIFFLIDTNAKMWTENYWSCRFRKKLLKFLQGDKGDGTLCFWSRTILRAVGVSYVEVSAHLDLLVPTQYITHQPHSIPHHPSKSASRWACKNILVSPPHTPCTTHIPHWSIEEKLECTSDL